MSRASLFKYLKYDKLTEKYCNPSSDCTCCSVREECDYITHLDAPLLLEIKWFLESIPDKISWAIANYYARHKKTHYMCSICGMLEAPYFGDNKYLRTSITHGYGWWKEKSHLRHTRRVCHHCKEHHKSMTWDELQKFVKRSNKRVLDNIKTKDPEYYKKWFHEEEV